MVKRFIRRAWAALSVNDVTAGKSVWYPELKPLQVKGSARSMMQAAKRAVQEGEPLWEIRSYSPNNRRLEAVVETPLLGFKDDVSVWLEPVQPGPGGNPSPDNWNVMVRSRSRIGYGDLGKNAQNIRRFYRRLERRLQRVGKDVQQGSRSSNGVSGL